MLRIILKIDLDEEFWGAERCYVEGGSSQVIELCKEDLQAFVENADWHVVVVPDKKKPGSDNDT